MDHPEKSGKDEHDIPTGGQSSRDSQETTEAQWERPDPNVTRASPQEDHADSLALDDAGDEDEDPMTSVANDDQVQNAIDHDQTQNVTPEPDLPKNPPVEQPQGQKSRASTASSTRKGKPRKDEWGVAREFPPGSGLWQWAENKEGPWYGATLFTDEIRREYIRWEAKRGSYSVDKARPNGRGGDTDVTAFRPHQKHWGPRRAERPDILMQYEKRGQSKEEKDGQKHPGYLRFRGRIVIAPDKVPHRPVLDYPDIPLTLSSTEPGWALEAMSRLNEFIQIQDFLDRMPAHHRPHANALSMRRTRYRNESGSLAWMTREGTKELKAYLDTLIPKDLREANTTRGFRDLERDEVEQMKKANKGQYSNRKRKDPPAQAGPSTTKKAKGKTAEAPSSSQSPQQTKRPSPQRTPAAKDQDKRKGKGRTEDPEPRGFASGPQQQEERYDFRDALPMDRNERMIIHHALMLTRLEITDITRRPTPATDVHASYNEQWEVLHLHMQLVWTQEAGFNIQRLPVVVRHGPWFDDFPQDLLNYQGEHAPIDPE